MTVDEKQLRLTLNHLFRSSRGNELYPALLEMLDRDALMFRWEECDGKPVRVWSLKIGAVIEHAVAAVKDEVRAELLGLFVDGELVFTNRYEDHSGGPVDCTAAFPSAPDRGLLRPCRGSRTTESFSGGSKLRCFL